MTTPTTPTPETTQDPPPATATPEDTRNKLLSLTGRGYTVVRHILCQLPATDDPTASRVSVLGPLVTERKRRSLQAYLLLLTVWNWLSQQEKPYLHSKVWARALNTTGGRLWTPSTVSAAWTDLEHRGLITKGHRYGDGIEVRPRREDGADDYTNPGEAKGDFHHTYFILPREFWTTELYEKLSMPGLAMLLIIAGATSDKTTIWWSSHATAAAWYGLSERSVTAGLNDLRKHNLLHEEQEYEKNPLSATGWRTKTKYALAAPFSTKARAGIQEHARTAALERASTTTPVQKTKKTGKRKKKED